MAKNPVNGVVQYVISKHVSTEAYREGLRTGTRANFHMEVPEAAVLLQYISQKEGCTPEQAVSRFTTWRTSVLESKAKSPKELGLIGGTFISLLLMVLPAILLPMLGDSMWLKVAAAALMPLVFFALFMLIAWRPRHRAMNAVWKSGDMLSERLEKLHEVQEMSLLQLIGEYQKPQGVAFAVIALLCIIGLPTLAAANLLKQEEFHKTMTAITVSANNAGTRYVVYDADERKYVDKYLSDERQAMTAEDVCAVLRIDEGEIAVGRYEGQGNAYKRYVTIELVDQRTGEAVFSEMIYGSEPPNTISVKAGTRNQNGYGSHPSTADITEMCEMMIQAFESMK